MARFFKNMSLLYKISLVVGGCILVVEMLLMIPSVFSRRSQLLEAFHERRYEIFQIMEKPSISPLASHDLNEAQRLIDREVRAYALRIVLLTLIIVVLTSVAVILVVN